MDKIQFIILHFGLLWIFVTVFIPFLLNGNKRSRNKQKKKKYIQKPLDEFAEIHEFIDYDCIDFDYEEF